MDIKTLDALSAFVYATKSLLCETSEMGYNNTDLHEAAEALEGELERELIVAKAMKAITEADDDTLYGYLPEMLKRQAE